MKNLYLALSLLIVLISCSNVKSEKMIQPRVNKVDSTTIKHIFNTALTNGQ